MSTVLDLAIAVSIADHSISGVNKIIGQFKLMEGASDDVQKKMNSFKNMAFTGGAFAVGGVLAFNAVANAATDAVTRAGNLQEIMTEIKAQTFGKQLFDPSSANEISTKMKEIEDLSTRLGLETTFSNLDAGEVIRDLQKGGLQYKDIMDGAAEATIKFAQLNEMAPTAAAELMVQTRAGFQLTGQQMLEAADTVTKVAAASSAGAEDINRGLGNMAGVASQMWGTRGKYEQVMDSSALVALTRTQTAEGSSAGTFVRNFLERLVPQTKKQTEYMASVGWLDKNDKSIFLDYSKDSRGQLKSATDIAKILRKTVGNGKLLADEKSVEKEFALAEQGMGTDKLIKLFHKVFGEQGGRTAYTLLRTGEGSLEEILGGVDKQLSLTDRVRMQMENYNQVLDTAKEAWNTFMTSLGSPLLKQATDLFAFLNDQLSIAAIYFQEHPEVSKYMFAIAGGVSAFLAIAGSVTVAYAAFGALTTALNIAGIGLSVVIYKSLGFLLAGAALIGLGYLIYKNWDKLKNLWEEYGWVVKAVAGILLVAYAPAILVVSTQMVALGVATAFSTVKTILFRLASIGAALILGAYRSVMLAVTAAQWIYSFATGAATASTWLQYLAVFALAPIIMTVRLAVMAWTGVQWLLNLALAANPIGAVIMIIVGAISVVGLAIYYWKEWTGALKRFADFLPGWAIILLNVFFPIIGIPLTLIKYWDKVVSVVKEFLGLQSEVEEPKDPKLPENVKLPAELDITKINKQLEQLNGTDKDMTLKGIELPVNLNVEDLQKQLSSGLDLEALQVKSEDIQKMFQMTGKDSGGELAKGLSDPESMNKIMKSTSAITDNFTNNLPKKEDTHKYGQNLTASFAEGMKSKIDLVRSAAQMIAQTSKDYLGVQSPTKEGPLRTNHLWGGNLAKSIAGGMLNNLHLIKNAATYTAEALQVGTDHKTNSNINAVKPVRSSSVIIQGPLIGAIHQQPGEDQEAFVRRIKREVINDLGRSAQRANMTMGRGAFGGAN